MLPRFVTGFTNRRDGRRTNAYISSKFPSARDNKRPNADKRLRPLWQHDLGLFKKRGFELVWMDVLCVRLC